MLQTLERGNLFLVPLDDQRRWYRYHHLFADVLQARLLDERPELVPGAAPAGERVVRRQRRAGGGDPARDGRRRRRAGRGPGGAEPRRGAPATVRSRCSGAGWRPCPTTWSGCGRCSASPYAGSMLATAEVARGRGAAAGRRALARRGLRRRGPARRSAGRDGRRQRAGVRLAADLGRGLPRRPGAGPGRRARRPSSTPAERSTLRDEDDLLALGAGTALIGLASWATGDLETTYDVVRRLPGHLRAGRSRGGRHGHRDHGRRHLRHLGPARRGDAHLRGRAALSRRPRRATAARDR